MYFYIDTSIKIIGIKKKLLTRVVWYWNQKKDFIINIF